MPEPLTSSLIATAPPGVPDGVYALQYDAATTSKRRRAPEVKLQSEDAELNRQTRGSLVATSRDAARNFAIAGWAVRQHLNYVASSAFQARTADEGFNKELEAFIDWWSAEENSDRANRHPLRRAVRMAEARAVVDGDVLAVKLADGRISWIEADRIGSPLELPGGTVGRKIVHGVVLDDGGAAQSYLICRRGNDGRTLTFDREVPARNAVLHAKWDSNRFDQVRGVSPVSSALNAYRDLYEAFDYALAKAKISQLFGLVFMRNAADSIGKVNATAAEAGEAGEQAEPRGYDVDLTGGPIMLDLDPGDKAEFLESRTPSTEFQSFTDVCILVALKALDIPFSFWREDFTNYSGARLAWIQYELGAREKRQDLADFKSRLVRWRLARAVAAGELKPPRSIGLEGLRWEWVPTGTPWIDPLKEIQADALAIDKTLTSRTRLCKQRGEEWREIIDELAAEQAYMAARGIAVAPPVTQVVVPADEQPAPAKKR